jgi:hypothetical protein
MIETEMRLKFILDKIKTLRESLENDLTEIPVDVRDRVVAEVRKLLANLEFEAPICS